MRCVICGQIFHGRNRRQETCGHRACQIARQRSRMRRIYAERHAGNKRKRGPRKNLPLPGGNWSLDVCPFASGRYAFRVAHGAVWTHGPDLYPLEFEPGILRDWRQSAACENQDENPPPLELAA